MVLCLVEIELSKKDIGTKSNAEPLEICILNGLQWPDWIKKSFTRYIETETRQSLQNLNILIEG